MAKSPFRPEAARKELATTPAATAIAIVAPLAEIIVRISTMIQYRSQLQVRGKLVARPVEKDARDEDASCARGVSPMSQGSGKSKTLYRRALDRGGFEGMDAVTAVAVRLQNAWFRVRDEESGQGLVEYALIIAIVSLGAVLALGFLSGRINDLSARPATRSTRFPPSRWGNGPGRPDA